MQNNIKITTVHYTFWQNIIYSYLSGLDLHGNIELQRNNLPWAWANIKINCKMFGRFGNEKFATHENAESTYSITFVTY